MAEVVEWREQKLVGLSVTVYRGLRMMDGGREIVSLLSHGFRVLPADEKRQIFNKLASRKVEVSDSFVKAVREAFEADQKLQLQIKDEYTRLMS